MEVIAAISAVVLTVILEEVIRRNIQRKKYEKEQMEKLNSILSSQTKHQHIISELRKDSSLTRVDVQSCVYALEKASNGIPFSTYISEKRDELMRKLEFTYED
jgi:Na+-translocating ferredoxin:NAD+ oxidoreductase RnfG subunit